eukprot:SAG11_NODE_264_length_11522_cov_14.739210_6_plen_179_part_00
MGVGAGVVLRNKDPRLAARDRTAVAAARFFGGAEQLTNAHARLPAYVHLILSRAVHSHCCWLLLLLLLRMGPFFDCFCQSVVLFCAFLEAGVAEAALAAGRAAARRADRCSWCTLRRVVSKLVALIVIQPKCGDALVIERGGETLRPDAGPAVRCGSVDVAVVGLVIILSAGAMLLEC